MTTDALGDVARTKGDQKPRQMPHEAQPSHTAESKL